MDHMKKNCIVGVMVAASLLLPSLVKAASADLAIDNGSITFSTSKFYSGDTVRIYARVRNLGDVDMEGSVVFYNGSKIIGATQPVSLRAGGAPEEVFVDFFVPDSSFNIYAVLAGSNPADENSSNDSAMTVLYTAILDADKDGVLDGADNCRDNANADQADLDHDGIGDVCDSVDNTPKPVAVVPPTPIVTPVPTVSAKIAAAPVTAPIATVTAPSAVSAAADSANSTTNSTSVNTLPSDNDGTVWPDKAYGIFDNAVAAEPAVAETSESFWRLTNPVVQVLLIVLGLLAIGCLLSVIVVRRKARGGQTEGMAEEVTEAEL